MEEAIKSLPDWIQAGVVLVGAIIAMIMSHTSLDSRIQVVETKLDTFEARLEDYDKVYDRHITTVEKLTEVVNKLSITVAKVEVRLEAANDKIDDKK